MMLRAELPVQRNSTLYGRSAMGALSRVRQTLRHAGRRTRAQREKLFAPLHVLGRAAPRDDAIALAREEFRGSLSEQDQLTDVGRARHAFELVDNSSPQTPFAAIWSHNHGPE